MPDHTLPTLEFPDNDPHLWLEDIHGAKAVEWVEAQNARTLARFGGPVRDADTAALAHIYDRQDNIPLVTRRSHDLYNFWKDDRNPRGLWRRTTLDSFRTQQPDWETILDVDALAQAEGEDWIWQGGVTLGPEHRLAMVRLSRGGSDAVELREYDIGSKSFVADGFRLPEAKGGVAWLDRDTLLVSTSHGENMATTSGYGRTIRILERGRSIEQAPVIFKVPARHMAASGHVDHTGKCERIWFFDRPGFFDCTYWIGDRDGAHTKLDIPNGTEVEACGDWMALKPREPWTVDGRTYGADTVLGISIDALLAGDRNFTVLFEPADRRAIANWFWNSGALILQILDELRPRFERHTPSANGWSPQQLAGLPDIGTVSIWPVDSAEEERNGDFFVMAQDPVTPATFSIVETGKAPAILKRAPETFRTDGLVVTQHEAVSSDGERIPYFQTGPENPGPGAPVHMYGYGGFASSALPYYNSAVGKLWLERGGVSVTTNLRGGGEFGVRWHEAGRRENKPRSHDDFAAIAADLVARGVTRPERIAAEGGSNGGILITNMLTRYPDRFGALFCTIPLIDMRRYSRLLAGASWIAEYGDPDKPEDWDFLQHYSAYHTAKAGQPYPPILLATMHRDDRVHPGHARKMAAKLQAMGYEAWFYEPAAGGHGYGKDNRERAAFTALGFAFLREKIGWA
ncbi:MAG: S9 family peptidase [Hyphomicrobiales bacterium]|nr:S9 family peptidase [Hyphomicrobiales bacterium]